MVGELREVWVGRGEGTRKVRAGGRKEGGGCVRMERGGAVVRREGCGETGCCEGGCVGVGVV